MITFHRNSDRTLAEFLVDLKIELHDDNSDRTLAEIVVVLGQKRKLLLSTLDSNVNSNRTLEEFTVDCSKVLIGNSHRSLAEFTVIFFLNF
jgi:hypothetical protein